MKPSTSGESDRTRLEPTDEEVAKLPSQKFEDEVVDWNGPDDPDNPLNWSTAKSFGHVVIVAVLSMVV